MSFAKMKQTMNEVRELAVVAIREWLSDFYPPSKIDRAIDWEIKSDGDSENEDYNHRLVITFKLFTSNNEYTTYVSSPFKAGDPRDVLKEAYMGAGANSRTRRTGETWTRGNDLPDGKFSEELWAEICKAILRYETQEIQSEKWKSKSKKDFSSLV